MRIQYSSMLLVVCALAACGRGVSSEPGSCTPGESIACACTDGKMGAQVCSSSHTYGACSCTGGGGPGTGNGDDGGMPTIHKLVFITSASYSGNLTAMTGDAKGLDAGDHACTNAATAAGLGGQWRAWLSDSATNAIDRIADVGPWQLRDGTTVFNNKANLATTALAPINIDENGMRVQEWDGSYHHYVWTGTQVGGLHAMTTCTDWTTTSGDGAVGELSTQMWTGPGAISCDSGGSSRMHLYCFQQ